MNITKAIPENTILITARAIPAKGCYGDEPPAFDYEVTVHCMEGGIDGVVLQKRAYSPGLFLPPDREPLKVTCPFLRNELYYDLPLIFEVRALNCFGAASEPIDSGTVRFKGVVVKW